MIKKGGFGYNNSIKNKQKGPVNMKIIHCADLHLDSKLEANLSKEKAKQRKGEILNTFVRMIDYAEKENVEIILIAGDLFDRNNISATASNTVKNAIYSHPGIRFYYLKGNHDSAWIFNNPEDIPENLKVFDDHWTSYHEADGRITISGVELLSSNAGSIYNTLVLDNSTFNIVLLHGQEAGSTSKSKDKTEVINIKALKNKAIDYLALGHIHAPKTERLDARGVYCYPGCLDGRGFDECGEHGFMVLDVDTDTLKLSYEFIPFASRKLYTIECDVSGCISSAEMISKVDEALGSTDCTGNDLIKIVLKGSVDIDCEKDPDYILSAFSDRYFFAKLYDETTPYVDPNDYALDSSLKGEFVRGILNDPDIDEADKPFIIKIGLNAILGTK